ncbi:hypothetical protein ACFL5L_04835 [candidate division KSB1 bacterium]
MYKELSAHEQEEVRIHIKLCSSCSLKLEQLREIDAFGRDRVFPDPGENFWSAQRSQFGQRLQRETERRKRTAEPTTKRLFRLSAFRAASVLSAAAVLLVAITLRTGIFENNTIAIEEYSPQTASDRTPVLTVDIQVIEAEQPKLRQQTVIVENPYTKKSAAEDDEINANMPAFITETPREYRKPDKEPESEEPELMLPGNNVPERSEAQLMVRPDPARLTDINLNRPAPVSGFGRGLQQTDVVQKESIFSGTEPLQLPENEEEEFDAYLYNKSLIDNLNNPVDQLKYWNLFLEEVEGEITVALVVNDIYDIYYRITYPNSMTDIKKNALEFVVTHKTTLTTRMGKERYQEVLKYFRAIQ